MTEKSSQRKELAAYEADTLGGVQIFMSRLDFLCIFMEELEFRCV